MRKLLFILLLSPLFIKAQTIDSVEPYIIVLRYLTPNGQQPNVIDNIANDSSDVAVPVFATTLLRAIYKAKHYYILGGTQPYLISKYKRSFQPW